MPLIAHVAILDLNEIHRSDLSGIFGSIELQHPLKDVEHCHLEVQK